MHDIQGLSTKDAGKTALEGRCGVCGESMFTIGSTDELEQVTHDEQRALPSMIGYA